MIMKRISLLLTVLILFCGRVGAQNEKISFNETEHDFGVIGDKDGNVSFDFILKNNSDAPLVITNAQAPCGCTTPAWTREPVEPGKTGTITVSFNPLNQIGSFTKPITITTSQASRYYVSISGEVVRSEAIVRKLSPEEEYPVTIGSYLLKTKELSFGRVDLKEKKTIKLEVFNNSDKPVSQKIQKSPKYITVDFNPVVIPAKTAATIDVNIEALDNNLYGDLSGEITLLINGVSQPFPYSANVIDDFSRWTTTKKANAGKINVSATEINFGNLSSGNSRILKISNSGKSSLNVRTIKINDPSITVSKANFVVNPGEIEEVKINVDNKKIQSNLSSTLAIITDDPNMPVYEIAIKATKKL